MDAEVVEKTAKVRARVRRHVWSLLHLRPGGFPWLTAAVKRLHGEDIMSESPSRSTTGPS
ncbi:hypothetical protein [Streptomyces sp. NPDC055085]